MLPALAGAAVKGAASLIGSRMNAIAADNAADEAWDRQAKVLKKQIQWRVKDAVAAGIHPLAALGTVPASGGPMASIGADYQSALGDMGADLGRAVESAMTPEDQTASQLTRLAVERGGLENDLLRAQIASQRMRNIQQMTPGIRRSGPDMGPGNSYQFPDGSLKPGDNQMGSKAFLFSDGEGWTVGLPGAAQQVADNYGDAAQELYGLWRLGADMYNSLEGDGLIGQSAGDVIKSYIPKYLADPGSPGEAPVFVW